MAPKKTHASQHRLNKNNFNSRNTLFLLPDPTLTQILIGTLRLRPPAVFRTPVAAEFRFQVKTVGSKAYHIVDLVTGKTCGFRFEYARAVDYAMQLEEKASRLPGGAQ
jgi:hypothetical protein